MVRISHHGYGGGSKPAGAIGKLGWSLFFLLFFALGSLFEVFVVREFGRVIGQRSWGRTPCTIVGSEVQERGGGDSPFVFAVTYRYDYAGQSYTGSAYRSQESASRSYTETQRLARKYPPALATFCYVNPKDPSVAVLKRNSLALAFVIPLPLIFVVIGAGGVCLIWHKKRPEAEKPIAAGAIGKDKKDTGKNRYFAAALFAVFALVGGALLYPLGLKPIARTAAAKSWLAVPCKVLRAEVRSHSGDKETTYSVYILYQYEFKGQTYKCDRYEFLGGSSSGYQGKARVVDQYKAAVNPSCYVNPADPFDAVLQRGFHAKLLLALLPLAFLLIGIGGLVPALRGRTLPEGRVTGSWAPDHGAPPPSGVVLRIPQPGAAGPQGLVVLTPRFSPKAKLIGIIVLALFGNGFLALFTWSPISSVLHGHPNWLGLFFVSPLIAIGIGLVGGVAYQGLALSNPCPTLELSSNTIPLGGAAELRWSLSGRTSRIDEFTVTLQGVEEARYRRGTSTYTDRNTFYEMGLYRTSEANEIASGQVGFVLPQDTMHSFEAENNKILWNLEVHGSIRHWPDVKESFKIIVTPRDA